MKCFFIPACLLVAPLQGQDLFKSVFPAGASRVDSEVDGIFSSDIKVVSFTTRFQQQRGKTLYQFGVGRTDHDVDYAPAPGTFTLPESLREEAYNVEFGVQHDYRPDLQFNLSATYSDGFTDHRSLWISEFYRQSFQFLPSFEDPDPLSFSTSTGFEWDISSKHKLVGSYSFSRARIVSGNAIDPVTFDDVVIEEPFLNTHSGSLRWETVIGNRIRTQQTFQVSRVDAREERFQFRSDWALGLTDKLTLRLQAGVADEDPAFEAYYGGVSLAYEVTPHWQIDLGYRRYEDTGEITASNFNTAAPGLSSAEYTISALYQTGSTSVRAALGIFDSDFDPITNPENTVFANLFRDREFVTARIAFTRTF